MKCDICGELHQLNEGKIIQGSGHTYFVCDDCSPDNFVICDDCGELVKEHRTYTTHDGRIICENCYESNDYYTCAECGEFVHQDYAYWDEGNDDMYCEYCYSTKIGSQVINSYHSNNDWTVHYTEKEYNDDMSDKLTLGLEIEVAGDASYAEGFMDKVDNDLIYLERDGSVDGFEIITQPMTRKYATELFEDKIVKGFKFLKENNFKGHNAGGIHIHVRLPYNKSGFMSCVFKLKKLLYNLPTNMQYLLLLISQRKSDNLEQWSNNICSKLTLQDCMVQGNRYELLNMDGRTRTLEFRMFNSNLRTERIMKNIEVVLSLLDYVETYYTVDMYNKNLFTWLDYVKSNEEKYPNLVRFINEDKIKDKLCEIGYIKEGAESICA